MTESILLTPGKKAYFISDLHLGLHPKDQSLIREKKVVQWLDFIKDDVQVLFLVGDIFDYWYEYKHVAPQGFLRFLGTLAQLADNGVEIHFFTGNHDVWVFDYLPREIGLRVHHRAFLININNQTFYLAHGDGCGPGDVGYKMLKWVFNNKTLQWLFSHLVHPDFSMKLGHYWSKNSRYARGLIETYMGDHREYQVLFAKEKLKKEHFDYFIFGHRHLAKDNDLNGKSRLIMLGEWITLSTYAVFDGTHLSLLEFIPDANS